jgi:hypothetical protein
MVPVGVDANRQAVIPGDYLSVEKFNGVIVVTHDSEPSIQFGISASLRRFSSPATLSLFE